MSVADFRLDLVERLRSRRCEIEETIVARICAVEGDPTFSGDAHYEEGQRMAVRALLDYALSELEQAQQRSTPLPSEVVSQAHRAARSGVGLKTILRRCAAGNALLADFVMQEADSGGLLGHGTALRDLQKTQASLFDRLIVSVSDEYAREVQRTSRSPEQRQADRVRRLLAGGHVSANELDYEFDAWHLGLIGTGVEARPGLQPMAAALHGLAADLDCRLLCVSADEQSVWTWLGGQRGLAADRIEPLLATRWPAGLSLAVGEPAEGLDGWRLTHWQAQDALLVSLRQAQMVTLYADIALLVPWLRDPTRSQWLIEKHLSPLENHGCSGATLRETLRAYFAAGHNSSAAARALYVSRRTMRNRLVLIEESLGPLLDTNQAELELALRLDQLI